MRAIAAGALLVLAMTGCSASSPKGPCEGLVYTDAGLTREQYAPCAKAMVAKLDDIWQDIETLHNKDLSRAERMRARQSCMGRISQLARMWKQAGGTSKLVSMAWDDRELNRFNYDIDDSRTAYLSYCYYGGAIPRSMIEPSHDDASRFAATLR
jgi:hypothetical protein